MKARTRLLRAALCALCCLTLMLPACPVARAQGYTRYQTVFYDAFDTVIQLIGFAASEKEFTDCAAMAQQMFRRYHQLFNQYEEYPDVVNVCTLNRLAKDGPIEVSQELFDLLALCREWQKTFGSSRVNIAFGSVLSLWHEAREAGIADPEHAYVPDTALLQSAAQHTDIEDLILDPLTCRVSYADPELQLDLGAVAKGYAAELVKQALLKTSMRSFILNAGGNVCLGESPMDGRECWGVGVQDPDKTQDYMDVLYMARRNIVTSGDYQRYYTVQGKRYSHLISPVTLMPADQFRGVTVVADDAGLCDFLSTYLFIAPYEEGRALIDGMDGVEAYWIFADRSVQMTDGMRAYARSMGAVSH